MPTRHFTIPFIFRSQNGVPTFAADFTLSFRDKSGAFVDIDNVRFDTGTAITTLPTQTADDYHIPYSKRRRMRVRGATGRGLAYLDKATFSFIDVPSLEFTIDCLFNPKAPRPLISLRDVVRNFDFASKPPSSRLPCGGFLLSLRRDHDGSPR